MIGHDVEIARRADRFARRVVDHGEGDRAGTLDLELDVTTGLIGRDDRRSHRHVLEDIGIDRFNDVGGVLEGDRFESDDLVRERDGDAVHRFESVHGQSYLYR